MEYESRRNVTDSGFEVTDVFDESIGCVTDSVFEVTDVIFCCVQIKYES